MEKKPKKKDMVKKNNRRGRVKEKEKEKEEEYKLGHLYLIQIMKCSL